LLNFYYDSTIAAKAAAEAATATPSAAASTLVTAIAAAISQTDAQRLLDYAQAITNTGEELMFTMDIPYVPTQDTPIVLAQAAVPTAGNGTQQPDYLLTECKDTTSGNNQNAAENGVDPAGWLAGFLDNRDNRFIEESAVATIKLTMLQSTTHGKLIYHKTDAGLEYYMYQAEHGYKGKDSAVFLVTFEGKTYKEVITLNVYPEVGIPDNVPSTCPTNDTIIKLKKPASGSSGLDIGAITVNIADLPGSEVGQTTGTTITLDTNAANYGWFIDPTPADNSEFLPTSNPDVWIAKAGTEAAGKMDMLSVLLHEYGHALGIDHSADNGDYMAATLQPGERRLPSADELALMSQLVAQLQPDDATASGLVGWASAQQVGMNSDLPDSPTSPTLPIGTALSALFIGRLRRTDYGSWTPVIDSIQIPAPQFELAITLFNLPVNLNKDSSKSL
jgi:hypothetical protein